MPDPLVSILILTYNHEKFIRDAIEGCVAQKADFHYEILIHDDASKDKTSEIVIGYAEKYPGLIFPVLQIENQYSKGIKITSTLLPKARGKYIAFCEGDDYWIDPYKLQKQIEIMENDPSISLCFTATKWVLLYDSNKEKIMRYYKGNHFFSEKDVVMKGGRFTDIVSTVVRKEIFSEIPEWYYLSPSGDDVLYLLAMIKGKSFYLDEITSVYRKGVEKSASTLAKANLATQVKNLKKIIETRNSFDVQTNFKYHKLIQNRNTKDLMGLSYRIDDLEFRKQNYHQLTFLGKIIYHTSHALLTKKTYFKLRNIKNRIFQNN